MVCRCLAVGRAFPDALEYLLQLPGARNDDAYPGSGKIDEDIQEKIDEFVRSQNDTSELFFFLSITQRELFQHFVHEAAPPQIDLSIRLAHYGLVDRG
jgi:hypothetical protein